MKQKQITTKQLKKLYDEYVEKYETLDEIPTIWTFNRLANFDNIYILNIINNINNNKYDAKQLKVNKLFLEELNNIYINIKELIIHKLLNNNSNVKNSINIIKVLDTQYNSILGNYFKSLHQQNYKAIQVVIETKKNKEIIKV